MKIITPKECAELICDGAVIGSAVEGMAGWPEEIALAIEKRFLETGHPMNITHIHGAGAGDFGRNCTDGTRTCRGECCFAHDGLLARSIHGHVGASYKVVQKINENKIEAYNFPLGVIGQVLREQGRGMHGVLSKVGLGTFMDARFDGCKINDLTREHGEDLVKYIPDFMGEEYLYYTLPKIDAAILRATTSDYNGNLTYEHECVYCEALDLALAAKAAGGIVIATVERLAETGSLNPSSVKIPGILVDYVAVIEHPENQLQTQSTHYNPAFTGEVRAKLSSVETIPFGYEKVIARRAAMEITKGDTVNFGIGIPALIPAVFVEENCTELVTMVSDTGVIGGVPASGGDFGAHLNPEVIYSQTDSFSWFDQGGLDIAVFGLPEVDADGSLNTTFMNGRIQGAGGFPHIVANAKHSVFIGKFKAGKFDGHFENGKLIIDREGKYKKFLNKCAQISFNANEYVKKGRKCTYITERAVLVRDENGFWLTEVAPGVDIQRDIIDQMEWTPKIPECGVKLMPKEIFYEEWGALKSLMEK